MPPAPSTLRRDQPAAGILPSVGRPVIVGILNATPDSFHDGGRYADPVSAIARGKKLFSDGAAWVDVGGLSTRPGSSEISVDEEIARVSPVLSGLTSAIPSPGLLSIDTYRSAAARAALDAGATAINDVSGFSLDPSMCEFAASAKCPVVINHMKGAPKTMQADPRYDSIWDELLAFFEDRLNRFVRAGGAEEQIFLDPGIGFGKTLDHNLDILRHIRRLHALGRPVMLGCSRKSFIHDILSRPSSVFSNSSPDLLHSSPSLPTPSPEDRLPGSLAAAGWAALEGVDFLRVHDAAETAQFLAVFGALRHG